MKELMLVLMCVVGMAWGASVGSFGDNNLGGSPMGMPYVKPPTEAKEPCCMPKVWQGYFGESVEYAKGRPHDEEDHLDLDRRHHHSEPIHGQMAISGFTAADSNNKKVAAMMNIFQEKHVSNLTVIVDYTKHEMFLVDPAKKSCRKSAVEGEMAEQCVPKDAKFLGTTRMGYGDTNALNADMWAAKLKQKSPVPMVLDMEILVTPDHCIPVVEWGNGMSNGFRVKFGSSFFNIDPKISDPSVFTPPSYCDKAEEISFGQAQMDPMVSSIMQRFTQQ